MKVFIISGEASGDTHGANLMKSMLRIDSSIEFQYWGGDKMSRVANGLKKHYKELAFMGFVEVAKNISTIKKNFKICKSQIKEFNPDMVIFIDYPGFNLRMAKWVKSNNIKTIYYIAPQIWAWHKSRIHKIKKYIDKTFVILPFEKEFYAEHDYQVEYVGHPLLDEKKSFIKDDEFLEKYNLEKDKIIAVLPGSRAQEISKMLPTMLEVSQHYPEMVFCIAVKTSVNPDIYKEAIPSKHGRNIRIIKDDQYNLLSHARAAMVSSGTATLETALFKVPQVVCYRANALTVAIAKRLVSIKYISLVNIILDKPVVTELIQKDFTEDSLRIELDQVLGLKRVFILAAYEELINILGKSGASDNVAREILTSKT